MRRSIEVVQCSIIDTGAHAVVNASNPDAVVGGGVSRAFFNECGGDVLHKEMREKLDEEFDGEREPEDCLLTSGGTSKKIRFVLHVPSVDYRDPGTSSALTRAVLLAEREGPIAVAFPLPGAGSGGEAWTACRTDLEAPDVAKPLCPDALLDINSLTRTENPSIPGASVATYRWTIAGGGAGR